LDVSPLVSAYRYRYHVLDAYGPQTKGLERPAPTIEEALRLDAQRLRLADNPGEALKNLAARTNNDTLAALRGVIAKSENDLALSIARLGTDLGAPATGPHIDLRAKLDGIDRSYRTRELEPLDFDAWYDTFDAQIGHLAALAALAHEVTESQGPAVKVPDHGPGRLKWLLVALVLAAAIALGLVVVTSMNSVETRDGAPPTGAEAPRTVRTVPIIVAPQPTVEPAVDPCRHFPLEVAPEGASLVDSPNGRAVVRLEPGEKLVLRQVVVLGEARFVEVDVPARNARGYLAEREARMAPMQWTCDR
jgi:hypothetical protein